MQPFLDGYTASGHLEQAAVQLNVSASNVRFQVEHHSEFAAASAKSQAKVALRLWGEHRQRMQDAGLLGPSAGSSATLPVQPARIATPNFGKHTNILLCADMESLVRLVVRVAEQAGVSEISGLPLLNWFNAQRHVQVDRFVRSLRREFPAYANDVERELDCLAEHGHDPQDAPHPPED